MNLKKMATFSFLKKILQELETRAKPQTVVPCWVCGQIFQNDIRLQTYMNIHWRENIAQDKNFTITSSFNQKLLYITGSDYSFIKDINEPIDCILDGFKRFKSYKLKVTANCVYRKRAPDGEEGFPKTVKINFKTDEYMTIWLNQWLNHVKETYEGSGYNYEFMGVSDLQLNIETTQPSLGFYTELPPGPRSKTKAILNIRNNKFNCLRLCITAALFPAADHTTRKSKYIKNLVDDWEDNENTCDLLKRLQNKYNINIWFFRPITKDGSITKDRPITMDIPTTEDKPTTENKPPTEGDGARASGVGWCKDIRSCSPTTLALPQHGRSPILK